MTRKVPMLDLKAEWALYGDDVRAAMERVLEHQQFVGGPEVRQFEAAMAERCGVRHAIAVSNGTEALVCGLMALGIGPGDEVITTPFTFFATAGSIVRVGARPVFVDIEPDTFNIDPALIDQAVTPQTRAIMPVHLFGQCADMDPILAIAERRRLDVVEDAAQAIGASYRGRAAGSMGTMATLSFYPTKNLATIGEGGMILVQDDAVAEKCARIRNQGERQRYYHQYVGGNFRLDTLKAAVLLAKLKYVEGLTRRRQANAAYYDRHLAARLAEPVPGDSREGIPARLGARKDSRTSEGRDSRTSSITTPAVREGNTHVYHQYSILCERRDELVQHLAECGVAATIFYPIPVHLQECLASLGHHEGDFPIAESVAGRICSIPVQPMLGDEDLAQVVDALARFAPAAQPTVTV